MRPDILIPVHEQTDVASARRAALVVASRVGFHEQAAGELALIVTEASSNLLKHGGGGDLILRETSSGALPVIEVVALDTGKGMANVARCFSDGFTTSGSSGSGLGAISRLSAFHDVYSQPQKGTALMVQVGPGTAVANNRFEIGAITIPYPGELVCGDAWDFDVSPKRIRIVVADGLGHGVLAAEASATAISLIADERSSEPANLIENSHPLLKDTRGAAIAVMDIDDSDRTMTFAGVGNIAAAIIGEGGARRQTVSMNGTLGHEMRAVRQYQYPLPPQALMVLHSDGIGTHWSFDKYPGLMQRHPTVIAGVLFRDFRRLRDDATVVVLRLGGAPE